MKILFVYLIISLTFSAAVFAFAVVCYFRKNGKPVNPLKRKFFIIISYNPDATPGIRKQQRYLLPRELATLRANTMLKQFTFKNFATYQTYLLKTKLFNLYELAIKTATKDNKRNL